MPVHISNLLAPNIYVFDDFSSTVQLSYAVQPKELKAQFDRFIRDRQLSRQSQQSQSQTQKSQISSQLFNTNTDYSQHLLTNETPHSARSHSALPDEPSVSQISGIARQAIRYGLIRPQDRPDRLDRPEFSRMTSTAL